MPHREKLYLAVISTVENITLKLQGMSCASCENTIETAIQSVPGVTQSNVNFATEQANVTYNARQTNIAAIQTAVDVAGYSAQPISADVLAAPDDADLGLRHQN